MIVFITIVIAFNFIIFKMSSNCARREEEMYVKNRIKNPTDFQ